jgi:hypothetical protein
MFDDVPTADSAPPEREWRRIDFGVGDGWGGGGIDGARAHAGSAGAGDGGS